MVALDIILLFEKYLSPDCGFEGAESCFPKESQKVNHVDRSQRNEHCEIWIGMLAWLIDYC